MLNDNNDYIVVYIYRKNLELLRELDDKSGQGRAYGNLGNTYYLLSKFDDAIKCHKEVRIVNTFLFI